MDERIKKEQDSLNAKTAEQRSKLYELSTWRKKKSRRRKGNDINNSEKPDNRFSCNPLWIKIQKERAKKEIKYIFCAVIILFVAIIGEIIPRMWKTWFPIRNYDSISLVIIQIQATVQTLSIALLALASAQITESCYGINYNDFLFRIFPVWFKQKSLMILELILLAVNVYLHMFGLYNMVMAVFVIVCIFIGISANQLYSVFSGSGMDVEKAKAYLLFAIRDDNAIDNQISVFCSFCDDWMKRVEVQSNYAFEQEMTVFGELIAALVFSKEPKLRTILQEKCVGIIEVLSHSNNLEIRVRSLEFIGFVYQKIWSEIDTHKEVAKTCTSSVHIANEAYFNIITVINDATTEMLDRKFNWQDFVENIILNYHWLGHQEAKTGELISAMDIAAVMGWKAMGSKDLIKTRYFSASAFPDGLFESGQDALYGAKLKYSLALIKGGRLDILKDSVYLEGFASPFFPRSRWDVLLMLQIHCYLYYIAEWESEKCVSTELMQMCKDFLQDGTIKNIFLQLLRKSVKIDQIALRQGDTRIYTDRIQETVYSGLRSHEYFPKNGEAKCMILETAVEEFLIYTTLYIQRYYYSFDVVDSLVTEENAMYLYQRYILHEQPHIRFETFLRIIPYDSNQIANTVEILLQKFAKKLIKEIHQHALTEASSAQSSYDLNMDECAFCASQQNIIMDKLQQRFDSIISLEAASNEPITFNLLEVRTLTSTSLSDDIQQLYDNIPTNLVSQICNYLINNGIAIRKIKDGFSDDEEYFSFLSEPTYSLAMGSDWLFDATTFENHQRLCEIMKKKTVISTEFGDRGILLPKNAIQVFLHNVEIKISFGTKEHEHWTWDAEKQRYRYEVNTDIWLDFTEEEFTKYLHDRKKYIQIMLKMSLKIKEGAKVCVLVDR